MRIARLTVGLALVLVAGQAHAQLSVSKGDVVTLKIPSSLLDLDGRRIMDGSPIFVARIGIGLDDVTVNDVTDWRLTGFPSLIGLDLEKTDQKRNYTEVELRGDGINVKLRFDREFDDLDQAFREVVVVGGAEAAEVSAYRADIYDRIGEGVFKGPLAAVTPEARQALLSFAHMTAEGTGLSHEEFRGEDYLVVDLGTDSNVYNTLQLDQSGRVTRILNDRLLNVLKAFAEPVRDVDGIFGVKLTLEIGHRSFLGDAPADYDTLWLYVASTDAQGFADFELTNQELIDASFVIVNENRIKVALAGG